MQKIDIGKFLDESAEKELLRFSTAGSVDDGKSTLIGRLLHDSKGIYEDQLKALKKASTLSGAAGGEIDFALLTGGLKAEREAALAELEGLPLITGIRREDYRRRTAQARAQIREGLDVARRYASRAGRPPLGEIHTDPVDGITLYTARQKVQVRLGRGQMAARLRRLDRIWAELRRRGEQPAVIRLDDDRHPRRVAVRLATAESTGPS